MADYKIINDPIHGPIKLKKPYVDIIDTKQFQRLRHIHQLGCSHYVYPSATHTRFEHSIGVCHLAEKLAKKLQLQLEEEELMHKKDNRVERIQITNKEVECVAVAGLCHDLGHGPFSHVWEEVFKTNDMKEFLNAKDMEKFLNAEDKKDFFKTNGMKESLNPKNMKEFFKIYYDKKSFKTDDLIEWKHEMDSVKVFQKINEERKIFEENEENFICDLIEPNKEFRDNHNLADKFEKKSFLWEIVNNETNKVDVDKWDYFERDCHYLGKRNSFDFVRLMEFIRVVKNKDQRLVLAYRDKEAHNISHMFHMRWFFHHRYYQHNKTRLIGQMLVDAFELFDVGDRFNLRRSNDYDVISKLREVAEKKKEDRKAKLLDRIEERNFYTIICHRAVTSDELDIIKSKIKSDTKELTSDEAFFAELMKGSEKENFYFDFVKFDYGNKDKDPLIEVRFYNKESKNEVCSNEDALRFTVMQPQCLFEYVIYFVSKDVVTERKAQLQKQFKDWIEIMLKQDKNQNN